MGLAMSNMKLYISEVAVPYEAAARVGLRNLVDWHQFSWMFFDAEKKSRDFLTRVEEDKEGYRLILVSATQPSKDRVEGIGIANLKSREIGDWFFHKGTYKFDILASPVKSVGTKGSKKKNKIPITEEPKIAEWFMNQAKKSGFSISEINIRKKGGIQITRKNSSPMTINSVEISGVVEVLDENLLRATFAGGIGRSKAFGHGLLKIVPIIVS